jgi:DNA ligase-1
MTFKPMLASPLDLSKTSWPLYASPKLDGIRATVVDGKLLSRSLKPIQNKYISYMLSQDRLSGLDGELIVGDVTAKDVFARSTSGVMRQEGEPSFTFFVFDDYLENDQWVSRWGALQRRCNCIHPRIQLLKQELLYGEIELDRFEAQCIAKGYEGVITRRADAPYKFGRSTPKEGYLSKVKRFEDSEALVIHVVEEMFNGNEVETNELGRTKRSSAQAGKVGKNTMGALTVRDLKTGVEFNIGTGFTAAERAGWWDGRVGHIARTIVKYKFFPVGVKDAPRHPVYLGVRLPEDMS